MREIGIFQVLYANYWRGIAAGPKFRELVPLGPTKSVPMKVSHQQTDHRDIICVS